MITLGERRVRIDFNPSRDDTVGTFKQKSAELINDCFKASEKNADIEVRRLWALAMTAYEEAAMWAVKAATA